MLAPLPPADWPEALAPLRDGFAGRLNVYGIMAHHPALLRSWQSFRGHVVVESTLGPQFSEVVILRTGLRLGSDYEWAHHVVRGRKVGLEDARILSIRGPVSAMEPADGILCTAVDQLFDSHRLGPATQEALIGLVGVPGMLDVMATVTHYSLLGFMLNSSAVPLDEDIATALATAPLRE